MAPRVTVNASMRAVELLVCTYPYSGAIEMAVMLVKEDIFELTLL